jgi:Cdc6-like AAA superfamily ATPase
VQPLFVDFAGYSPEELILILQARAEQSLAPDSWCAADLEAIAAASRGDARVVIQTLRTAAYLAEKHRSPQLRTKDIQEGITKCSELRRKYSLSGLSDHHRLIYAIVKQAGEIELPKAWKEYQEIASEQGIEPMERRTFNQYRQYMVANKLLTERYAKGRRNVLLLRVAE